MRSFTYTVKDEVGIHARPAGLLVNKVKSLGCRVTLTKDGRDADASKLFSIMALAVKCGDTVTVTVDGTDSDAKVLQAFFQENL